MAHPFHPPFTSPFYPTIPTVTASSTPNLHTNSSNSYDYGNPSHYYHFQHQPPPPNPNPTPPYSTSSHTQIYGNSNYYNQLQLQQQPPPPYPNPPPPNQNLPYSTSYYPYGYTNTISPISSPNPYPNNNFQQQPPAPNQYSNPNTIPAPPSIYPSYTYQPYASLSNSISGFGSTTHVDADTTCQQKIEEAFNVLKNGLTEMLKILSPSWIPPDKPNKETEEGKEEIEFNCSPEKFSLLKTRVEETTLSNPTQYRPPPDVNVTLAPSPPPKPQDKVFLFLTPQPQPQPPPLALSPPPKPPNVVSALFSTPVSQPQFRTPSLQHSSKLPITASTSAMTPNRSYNILGPPPKPPDTQTPPETVFSPSSFNPFLRPSANPPNSVNAASQSPALPFICSPPLPLDIVSSPLLLPPPPKPPDQDSIVIHYRPSSFSFWYEFVLLNRTGNNKTNPESLDLFDVSLWQSEPCTRNTIRVTYSPPTEACHVAMILPENPPTRLLCAFEFVLGSFNCKLSKSQSRAWFIFTWWLNFGSLSSTFQQTTPLVPPLCCKSQLLALEKE